jgi:hypothetical protein
MFEDLKAGMVVARPPTPHTPEKVETLRGKYPGIPEDYLAFLTEIGWGNFGSFMLYSEPGSPKFTYGAEREGLKGIILIGDDMQGYSFGFDAGNGFRLVEIDPRGNVDRSIEPDFSEFVHNLLGEGGDE